MEGLPWGSPTRVPIFLSAPHLGDSAFVFCPTRPQNCVERFPIPLFLSEAQTWLSAEKIR